MVQRPKTGAMSTTGDDTWLWMSCSTFSTHASKKNLLGATPSGRMLRIPHDAMAVELVVQGEAGIRILLWIKPSGFRCVLLLASSRLDRMNRLEDLKKTVFGKTR